MIGLLFALVGAGLFAAYAVRAQRQKERHADEVFKQTMIALENKAKAEGTFNVSYFGTSKTGNE